MSQARRRMLGASIGYALYLGFSSIALRMLSLFDLGGVPEPRMQSAVLASILVARLVAYLTAFAASAFLPRVNNGLLACIACGTALPALALCFMAMHLFTYIDLENLTTYFLFAGACLGISDASMSLIWARLCVTLSNLQTYLFALGCNATGIIIGYAVISLIDGPDLGIPCALMFVASAVLGYVALRPSTAKQGPENAKVTVEKHASKMDLLRLTWRPTLGASVFCFMSGLMMQTMGNQGHLQGTFQGAAFVATTVVIAAMAIPALAKRKAPDLGRMFTLALPISATGFVLLPLLGDQTTGIVGIFAQLGSMVSTVALWCMLANVSRSSDTDAICVFSPPLACVYIMQFLGMLAGQINARFPFDSTVSPTVVALIALYALAMVSPVVFKRRVHTENGSVTPMSDAMASMPTDNLEETRLRELSTRIATESGLTAREQDILLPLSQGLTIHELAEHFCVSDNTVKTHVKGIYQKLGIHTRSELNEMLK